MYTGESKNTDKILNSFDNIRRIPAPDFFYTRLKARMEKKREVPGYKRKLLQPVFLVSGLVILLLVNVFILIKSTNSKMETRNPDSDNMQILAAEYNANEIFTEEFNK